MTVTGTDPQTDGRRDFDFFIGRWKIHNRKLADVLDRDCTEWVEFEATGEMHPILDGLGNIDEFSAVLPDGRSYKGFTLRLFEPQTQLWKIWWASNNRPGQLDPPVVGRFAGRHGEFVGDDVLGGHPVKVKYTWTNTDERSCRWEQAFSYDDGETWKHNWAMSMTRAD